MVVLYIVIGVVVLLLLYWLLERNSMVGARNRVDEAWSGIDVQLKRRHDLIPNLVETVKGYAAHERGTFEAVTNARANAINAQGPQQTAEAENVLSGALKSLFAVAEAYPELKANQNFLALQEEVTSTEDKVAYARQFYNDSVLTYNTRIQQFPTVLLAGMFHFEKRDFFDAEPGDTEPVQVQF
jgi:LemA protein